MRSADLSLAMVRATPYRLILKLSWDNEWPANSDFVLRKRKKSAEAIWQTRRLAYCRFAFSAT
jgi:hypothetical protein